MAGLLSEELLKRLVSEKGPNLDLEIGLFSVVDVGPSDQVAFKEGMNILMERPFTRNIYSDIKEPGPGDYYLCSHCGERHLRECFDEGPDVIGKEEWVRYFVEVPEGDGYRRRLVPPAEWRMVEGNPGVLEADKYTIENLGETPWSVGGWFIWCEKGLFGFEIIRNGPLMVAKGGKITLNPTMTLGL